MIDHREAQYSAATGSRPFLVPRMGEAHLGVGFVSTRRGPVDHFVVSLGQRRKASMMHVSIPAPYAAMAMMRAVWLTPDRSWMRSFRLNARRLIREPLQGDR